MVDGLSYDVTAQRLLNLIQSDQPPASPTDAPTDAPTDGPTAPNRQQQLPSSLPLSVPEVQVLTAGQLQELAHFLLSGKPLPWPRPVFQPTLKTHLALAAHARLFRTPVAAAAANGKQRQQQWWRRRSGGEGEGGAGAASGGEGGGGGAGWGEEDAGRVEAAVGAQRPKLEGRNADKVRGG